MSTLQRKLLGKVSIFKTTSTTSINGSALPKYLYYDQKTVPNLWGLKGQLSRCFFRYQVIITNSQKPKIIWIPRSNLAFPDFLKRNVTVEDYQKHQLHHRRIHRDIEISDENGSPKTHRDQHEGTFNKFYLIQCQ